MKEFLKKIFCAFIYILATICCYRILTPFYVNICPKDESIVQPYISSLVEVSNNSLLQIFTSNEHLYALLSLLNVFSNKYLPELLKIHPVDCYENYTIYLLFFSFFILLNVLVQNFLKYIFNKQHYGVKFYICSSILIFPFLFVIFMLMYKIDFIWILPSDVWLYAYTLLPAFSLLLLSEIEKYYVFGEKLTKRDIFALVGLFIIVAFANEYFRFIVCAGTFIGYFLHVFLINREQNHFNKFILWIGICILNSFIFFTSCFRNWFADRDNHYSIIDLTTIFPAFIKAYWQTVFVENIWLWILVIILTVGILLSKKNTEKNTKIIIYSFSVIISALLFQIAIIIGVEEGYGIQFSFEHQGMIFITKLILLSIIVSLFGYLLAYENNAKIKIIIILFILICFIKYDYSRINYNVIKESNHADKMHLYILEQLFCLYGKENKVFYQYKRDWSISQPWSILYFIHLYDRNSKKEDYQLIYVCDDKDDDYTCEEKMKKLVQEKTGYIFTEEELSNPDFNKFRKYMWY